MAGEIQKQTYKSDQKQQILATRTTDRPSPLMKLTEAKKASAFRLYRKYAQHPANAGKSAIAERNCWISSTADVGLQKSACDLACTIIQLKWVG